MALRLIEVMHDGEDRDGVQGVLDDADVEDHWEVAGYRQGVTTRCIVHAEQVEAVVDALADLFDDREGFRAVILPVEATVPQIEEKEPKESKPLFGRVSRDELMEDVADGIRLDGTFVAMAGLSAVVAGLGLVTDNVPVIIGGMLIAPLLAPNMGLALATTLGDLSLGRRVLRSGLVGLGLPFALAVAIGAILAPAADGTQLALRTRVGLTDVVLALAAGTAGALTFTTALPGALIGVMVALTLLPALVTAAILLGAGHWEPAINAFVLFAINVIALNLAATGTFLAQGIRPTRWWDAKKARKATWQAIGVYTVVLALLAAAAWFGSTRGVV